MAPVKSSSSASFDPWSSHEDRLQRLEDDRVEMVAQVSEQTATLKSIQADIMELSACTKETNRALQQMMNKFQDKVYLDEKRLDSLEKEEVKGNKRAEWIRKIISGVVIGSAGALITFLIERFGQH